MMIRIELVNYYYLFFLLLGVGTQSFSHYGEPTPFLPHFLLNHLVEKKKNGNKIEWI